MKALVLADRLGDELAPLCERSAVALLPVAGKALIVHTLENLASAGVEEVFVVVADHAEKVEEFVGAGERWGLRINYVLTRGAEGALASFQRVARRLDEETLVIRGDAYLRAELAPFIDGARALAQPLVQAVRDGEPLGVAFVKGREPCSGLPESPENDELWRVTAPTISLTRVAFSRLVSLADYHDTCMRAIEGAQAERRALPGRNVAVGVHVGRRSRLPLRAVHDQPVLVGDRCEVDRNAELLDHVVLSNDVVIDRGATLRRTLVLPDTYVGELVELENAIVWSNILIRVDTGAVSKVTDTFLLADLKRATIGSFMESLVHRVGGALLLLLSLPLWPIMLAASYLANPSTPFRRVRMRGNRLHPDSSGRGRVPEFELLIPATRVPILRSLPGLEAVVTGDMRLVGVPPLTPDEASSRNEQWELVRDEAPAGLLAPSRLSVPEEAPEEERQMMDAYYARTRGPFEDARWLLRALLALFTSKAWSSRRA